MSHKARLGDHYMRRSMYWWLNLINRLVNERQNHVATIAYRSFCSSGLLVRVIFNVDDYLLASDAFAFGALKYGEVGGWRRDSLDYHLQAAGRHFHAWFEDAQSKDPESGLSHEAHFLARAVMVVALRETER